MSRSLIALLLLSGIVDAAEMDEDQYAYVIGASVSMGFNILGRGYSPPLYALENLGYPRDRVVKKTVITGSFRHKLKWLEQKFSSHPPSYIMGLDLFHHDVRQKNDISPRTYGYFDEMLELLAGSGAQVILGYTWTRYDNQATIDEMNAYLDDKRAAYPNLHFFPAHDVLDALSKPGHSFRYDVNGVRLSLTPDMRRKLLLDVVHPNDRGARLMANLLIDIANATADNPAPYYDVSDIQAMLVKARPKR